MHIHSLFTVLGYGVLAFLAWCLYMWIGYMVGKVMWKVWKPEYKGTIMAWLFFPLSYDKNNYGKHRDSISFADADYGKNIEVEDCTVENEDYFCKATAAFWPLNVLQAVMLGIFTPIIIATYWMVMFPFRSLEAAKNLNNNQKLHSLLDRANAWADRRNERRALAAERRKSGVRIDSSNDALNTLFARREELKRQMEDNAWSEHPRQCIELMVYQQHPNCLFRLLGASLSMLSDNNHLKNKGIHGKTEEWVT